MRIKTLAIAGLLLTLSAAALAEDLGWPKEIATAKGTAPDLPAADRPLQGQHPRGSRPRSRSPPGAPTEPVFGAFWFRALLETDFDSRTARLVRIQVPQLKFADETEEKQRE